MSLSHRLWNGRAPVRLHTSLALNPLHLPVRSQLCLTRVWSGLFWYSSSWARLVAELQDEQDDVLSALPQHVPGVAVQLLPLAWLLDLCNCPGPSDLLSELFWGFKLLGPLPPGSQWLNRTDAKYSRPLGKLNFAPSTQNFVSPGVCRPHQASTMLRCCQSCTKRLSSAEFRALCHCHWSRPKPHSLPSRLQGDSPYCRTTKSAAETTGSGRTTIALCPLVTAHLTWAHRLWSQGPLLARGWAPRPRYCGL